MAYLTIRKRRSALASLALICALVLYGIPANAFDHSFSNYGEALSQYVHEGRVDYAGLCRDRQALDRFLGEASVLSFEEYQTFSREQKMALMLNLYNASALALVCDHPKMKSVDEFKGLFHDVWSIKFIRLFGRTVGLAQLLHDILRLEFKDYRIHFALVTACKSDPDLLNVPYRAETLSQQLEEQTDRFMTRRIDANHFDHKVLFLSPKFRWYAVDFGDRLRVIRFAQRYFPEVSEKTSVRYTKFDWSLNSE